MDRHAWIEEFPGAVTVCDEKGTIIEMNEESARSFAEDGGAALIGKNVLDCHPEPARTKLAEMMAGRRTNVYTIEKNGDQEIDLSGPMVPGWEVPRVSSSFRSRSLSKCPISCARQAGIRPLAY